MKAWKITLALALVSVAATVVLAQEEKGRLRLAPDEIKAPAAATAQAGTSGAAGLQMGLLSGNPKQAGLYTVFLKLPPNTRIQAHSHPDDRVGIVVSGTWYFAYGDSFDESWSRASSPKWARASPVTGRDRAIPASREADHRTERDRRSPAPGGAQITSAR